MENLTQLRFKLNAAKQRNKRLSDNMAKLPGIIGIIGSTPIVDVNTKSAELQLIPFTQLHKYVGSYYAKIKKVLLAEGVIVRQNGMWHLREDLQKDGIAVYTTGRLGCYYVYHLKWTPKGVAFIKDIINHKTNH